MSRQQQMAQELSFSQILRTYGKHFTQIRKRYSDGHNGRCAIGAIMSYFGWNGKDDGDATRRLLATLVALKRADISKESLIEMNDSGFSFDEIADYLDETYELTNLK
jgi:hypothetical protein